MNIFKKNNILINGLLNDTFSFLQDTYNQTTNLFTVASAWGQILFVLQNLSQMILYFIEDSITELNIEQATRDYSVRSLARIAGYDPGRASTAQGEVSHKRVLGALGFLALIICMVITLYCKFELEVAKRLIEAVEYISIAYGLGTVAEKFANKNETNNQIIN